MKIIELLSINSIDDATGRTEVVNSIPLFRTILRTAPTRGLTWDQQCARSEVITALRDAEKAGATETLELEDAEHKTLCDAIKSNDRYPLASPEMTMVLKLALDAKPKPKLEVVKDREQG